MKCCRNFYLLFSILTVFSCPTFSLAQVVPQFDSSEDQTTDRVFDFDIPAGELGQSIIELSRQSGVSILFDSDLSKQPTTGIDGPHTVVEALLKLIADHPARLTKLPAGIVVQSNANNIEHQASTPSPRALNNETEDTPLRMSTVQVFGFAKALADTIDIKKNTFAISDSILAEDIGKYPELNLAESLQRIPGITISRSRGEGAEISLRGLSSDFTRVYLNDIPLLINTDRSRGFEFNSLSSDLFSQIEVRKSYDVTQDEGGIGGTILLSTPKPLELEPRVAVFSGQLGTNTNAEEPDTRLFGLLSGRSETKVGQVGILVSTSLYDRVSEGQDASTYRYRAVPIDPVFLNNLDEETAAAFSNGEVFIPRGNRYRVSQEDQSRIGLSTSLQWSPFQGLQIDLDGLYGSYDVVRTANNLQTRGPNSFPLTNAFSVNGETFGPSTIRAATVNQDSELEYAVFERALVGSENTLTGFETTFGQLGLSLNWQSHSGLSFSGLLGHSRSDSALREDKVYLETVSDLTVDFRGGNRLEPIYIYGGPNGLTDIADWRAHEIDRDAGRINHRLNIAKLNLKIPAWQNLSFNFGINAQNYESQASEGRTSNLLLDAFETGQLDDDISRIGRIFTDHDRANWVGLNVPDALGFYSASLNEPISSNPAFGLEETSLGIYSEASWRPNIQTPTEIRLGGRYIFQERKLSGGSLSIDDVVDQIDSSKISRSQEDFLPAIMTKIEPADNLVARLSASQNISHPPISALNPSTVLRTRNFQDAIVGDVRLDPYKSTNVDLYIERYFKGGLFNIGYFYKDLDNYVVLDATEAPFFTLGLPNSLLQPGQTENTLFSISSYTNGQETILKGWEVGLQTELGDIAPALNGWGVIANLTHASGRFVYTSVESDEEVTASFPGLSDYTANLSVFFETQQFGLRAAVAYRSDFLTNIEPGLRDEDSRGQLDTTFIDLAGYYYLPTGTQLTFDILNLSGEKEIAYSDSLQRLTERRESGTTVFVGLRHRF